MWRTSRLRLSEIANWKTCADVQPPEAFAPSVDVWPLGCGCAPASSSGATPSMWRTSRLRLSEIAKWKTCAEAQPP